MLPWYAAADVYLRTTVMEADNLSSHQAMAMGLPVVGFAGGASTDLLPTVGHGVAVPQQDGAALAAAIGRVLASDDHGGALGLLGRDYARTHLGLDRMIEALIVAYEELAAPRTPG